MAKVHVDSDSPKTAQSFSRLLLMWRGSLYKIIFRELILFLFLFGFLSAMYRHMLNPVQKKIFERVSNYFDEYVRDVPVTFILGFYIKLVADRWMAQYMGLPTFDKLMLSVNTYLTGSDKEKLLVRRTIVRQTNLMYVLVLRDISPAVKDEFPDTETLLKKGYMTIDEVDAYKKTPEPWLPAVWAINVLSHCNKKKVLADPQGAIAILEEILKIRDKCGTLYAYHLQSVPLVLNQVVTIATYFYFAGFLLSAQRVGDDMNTREAPIDAYIPVRTVMQFMLDMGLLRLAEHMLHPFGTDAGDIDLVYLINKNNRVIYLGTDTWHGVIPPMERTVPKDMTLDKKEAVWLELRKSALKSRQTVPNTEWVS